MPKRFTWASLLTPLVIVLNVATFAVEVVMLRAGTGGSLISNNNNNNNNNNNAQNPPNYPGWYALRIEADEYRYEHATSNGLPDSYDTSKMKDYFAMYPAVYCSGEKKSDGKGGFRYEADHCSSWGSLFDLQDLWRDYGVDLVKPTNYVGQNPRMMFTGLAVGGITTALTALLKAVGFCFFWSKVAACVLSWVSLACLVTMSVTSQMMTTNLVNNAHRLDVQGTGRISAQGGNIHLKISWAITIISLITALLETFILWRQYKLRKEKRNNINDNNKNNNNNGWKGRLGNLGGFVGGGGSGGGGGVYQNVGTAGHGGSHIQLVRPQSSGVSSMRDSFFAGGGKGGGGGDVTVRESAYEPMRHREFV